MYILIVMAALGGLLAHITREKSAQYANPQGESLPDPGLAAHLCRVAYALRAVVAFALLFATVKSFWDGQYVAGALAVVVALVWGFSFFGVWAVVEQATEASYGRSRKPAPPTTTLNTH